jgi:hypothetical protein
VVALHHARQIFEAQDLHPPTFDTNKAAISAALSCTLDEKLHTLDGETGGLDPIEG